MEAEMKAKSSSDPQVKCPSLQTDRNQIYTTPSAYGESARCGF